jgi:hypothetical protein
MPAMAGTYQHKRIKRTLLMTGSFPMWRFSGVQKFLDEYSSPSIIRIIKSRRMKWTGHVARMEEK